MKKKKVAGPKKKAKKPRAKAKKKVKAVKASKGVVELPLGTTLDTEPSHPWDDDEDEVDTNNEDDNSF